ncbi:DUF2156 domain-containing protein [Pseudooceanicola sediminis]|uniref:DUF2156 domain-containing protein n=1 Tax=Pseudooceanicola sediminis TaxID=2211117 RepID=A0A399J7H5_9RHOB|nr:phosphatidylglycerol lysyltransferase domain-containing protein [Pseudooceanicola sediminis]KAA2317172.1 DUF2156 domain-containing protein [Puniceibacterium sp. HSS470]RII40477.1 DUF2156 domain-containing protein [Pseudooceanicola sediminis]|tara:strand:- start:61784 stop:63697 length:1914 start_codon:yes stop_codon:yes gene_type:complete
MAWAIGSRLWARSGWVRLSAPFLIGAACLWLLAGRLTSLEPALMWQAFNAVTLSQWLAAALATAVSFWSLGRYDAVMHRHLRTGVPEGRAQVSGITAIALSQVLGLGMLTGTLARWRLLPDLGPLRAAKMTAAVAASFLLAWAVIAAVACAALAPALLPGWLAGCAIALALSLPLLSLLRPTLRIRRWRLRLPSLHAIGAIGFFALIDTLAAAAALQVFLLEGLPFTALFPAFLLALGAGLFAGTPGGVGPFELTLLALLPQVAEAEMVAAILGFRLVYYAIPATIAAVHVFRPRTHTPARPRTRIKRRVPEDLLLRALRAEAGIARQNNARVLASPHASALTVDTSQSLTLLFDPLTGPITPLLPRLAAAARASNRLPLVYKCSAAHAIAARRAGWRVARVADEAMIVPGDFSLSGSRHRQLRRKVRQAEKAGVVITQSSGSDLSPRLIDQMAALDQQWKQTHGEPRGLSMGRFEAGYIRHQRVYCAWQKDRLVAFVSFHENPNQLCLDLMRHGAGLPDGTMHLLTLRAIEDAGRANLPLSLAAMPARDVAEHALLSRIRTRVAKKTGGDGLCRFKDSFAPRRIALYIAAPTHASLILGAVDLALTMRRRPSQPDALPTADEEGYDERGIAPAAPM